MRKVKVFINLNISIISLITFFYVLINNQIEKYEYMFLLPLIFLISFNLVLKKFLFENISFFRITFVTVLFLRYSILPLIITMANYDHIVAAYYPTIAQCNLAIFLMTYELIAYSAFIKIYNLIKKNKALNDDFDFSYNNPIFNIFIVFSMILLFVTPSVLNYFNFISVNSSVHTIEFSNIQEITILCVVCAKGLLFLQILNYLSKKYKISNNNVYFYLGVLAAAINSCIYYGANRSTFIFLAIASFAAFFAFFKKGIKKIIIIISIIVITIIPIITSYRNYYDYYEKFTGLEKELISKQGLINEYFGGINNVAIGIETANLFSNKRNLVNLLYDFLRPVVGINIIMKKINMDYSNLYFNRCYHRSDLVSVIFPTISQGYFYFGFIGAPILGIIMIWIALKLERYCKDFKNPFYIYFFTPSLFRLGTLTGANVNIQMNDLSLKIMVPVLLLLIMKIVKKKK